MKLSQKKKTELYRTVSDEIMSARVEVILYLKGTKYMDKVDDVFYKLGMAAPQKALNVFNHKTP